ncbi:MAG TPA: class I SAM-dependent methyltransferase [Tepidisphaeraceae bacterium]|jgi:tRNA (cmo5U34)-methyltransferase|nr:class I SAM-dependent methyltransferase [Tepidisphaeraceae bacterium]
MAKSTPDEIRRRFDNDVERFANLQTGQSATIDAPLVLDLITAAAASVNPSARAVLDVGCGAGNYTLKLLEKIPGLDATLIDLSQPMLDRAAGRVRAAGCGGVTPIRGDIREISLPAGQFDVILAAVVLHHLRSDGEWESVFAKFHAALRPGGSIWISDLVEHAHRRVHAMMWERYGEYLAKLKDEKYRDEVFAYVEKEDTPRSLEYQLDLLKRVGFRRIEILHKNGPFAAFGATKD